MNDLVWVVVIAVQILTIGDVMNKLTGTVPRFLWIVAVLALPLIGAGVWYYVQYVAPDHKRRLRGR